MHRPQVSVSFAADKIDEYARLTTNRQIDRPAANAAIFDQRLLGFRRVDPQRKNFAAVWTSDFCFDDELHVAQV